jgi:hypothetical protein
MGLGKDLEMGLRKDRCHVERKRHFQQSFTQHQ